MKVLHVAGPSGAGKTRLIEALLPSLPVAWVIKWTHHPIGQDKPGSDTDRLSLGGTPTILAGPDGLVARWALGNRSLLYEYLARMLPDDALVVIEGHHADSHPKVWIGSDPPPSSALVIGPAAQGDSHWLTAALPLTDKDIINASDFLRHHYQRYLYTIGRDAHE